MSIITEQYSKRAPESVGRHSPEPLSFYASPLPETCSSVTAKEMEAPVEKHPWLPFIPDGAKVLVLGSFPPKRIRWSMDFFYPNFNNDFWRIIGLVFFGDKDHFITGRRFDKERIIRFCSSSGLALYDTAYEVRRLKDNASDKFLEIVTPVDIKGLLDAMPECRAVITTGEKASGIAAAQLGCQAPHTGEHVNLTLCDGRHSCSNENVKEISLYRLPSSSRAYPLSIARKAAEYSILKDLLDS